MGDFVESLFEGAGEDEELDFVEGDLASVQRDLRVDMLAGEFGVGPDVAGLAGEAGGDPFVVGGERGDHGKVDGAGFVVVGDAVVAVLDALVGDGRGELGEVARGKPLGERHGEARGVSEARRSNPSV